MISTKCTVGRPFCNLVFIQSTHLGAGSEALPPNIDLSTLDGSSLRDCHPAAEDQHVSGTEHTYPGSKPYSMDGISDSTSKSYYFPEDPNVPDWRPFVMSSVYIFLFVAVSIGLSVGQEQLYRHSEAQGHLLSFASPKDISTGNYFLWRYLPTILTVTYGLAYQTRDLQIRRLDPFYRLATPGGSHGPDSLLADTADFFTALRILIRDPLTKSGGRIALSVCTLLLSVVVVPSLQSASLGVRWTSKTSGYDVYVKPVWSRLLTASLGLIALLDVLLWLNINSSKSGLLSDPQGIAAVAAMATKSHVLQDFADFDLSSSNSQIKASLRRRRYVLYKSSIWQGQWRTSTLSGEAVQERQPFHPTTLSNRQMIATLSSMASVLGLVPVLVFTPANKALQKLPFLLTVFGVIVKMLWSQLDSNVRLTEPFYHLLRGNALSMNLTIDYTGNMPWLLPMSAFRRRHYTLATIAIHTVLLDVLTVCLASLGVNGHIFFHRTAVAPTASIVRGNAETFKSFWVSYVISTCIIASLCATLILVWLQRRDIVLPRRPGSIGFVLLSCCRGNWLTDLIDCETLNRQAMLTRLENIGKRYAMGWFKGHHGTICFGIDEEPLAQRWRYGKPFSRPLLEQLNSQHSAAHDPGSQGSRWAVLWPFGYGKFSQIHEALDAAGKANVEYY